MQGVHNRGMEDVTMLVLSRKEGEQIILDRDIVVEVLHIGKQRVRIGIAAPATTQILRKEVTPHSRSGSQGTRASAAVDSGHCREVPSHSPRNNGRRRPPLEAAVSCGRYNRHAQ